MPNEPREALRNKTSLLREAWLCHKSLGVFLGGFFGVSLAFKKKKATLTEHRFVQLNKVSYKATN